MTDMALLISRATDLSASYPGCTDEQALVYACEDVVDQELGSRTMASREAGEWIADICHCEDMDPPVITVSRPSRVTRASANDSENSICLRGASTTVTTIVHELAHLSSGSDSHGVLWRDEITRLTRAHVSVAHAALLHALFVGTGLEMSPWGASASRR